MRVIFGGSASRHRRLAVPALVVALVGVVWLLPAAADHLGMAWDAPTTNTDGTPLHDLAGYRVYYGTASTAAVAPPCNSSYVDVEDVPSYHLEGLRRGVRYYFRVTARDSSGQESRCSNQLIGVPGPAPPLFRGQRQADGKTSIPLAGTASWASVVFLGTVRDSDASQPVRLQVEVKPVGTAYTGKVSCQSGPVKNGTPASCTTHDLIPGTGYRWRARTVDSLGLASAWVSYATNPETHADFIAGNHRPTARPTLLLQRHNDGRTLPIGGTAATTTVAFRGTVTDWEAGQDLRLQVEVQRVGAAFTGKVSCQSPLVARGAGAACRVANLAPGTKYRWRARTTDRWGADGPWTPYGGNADTSADFVVTTAP
jgi:hypothetical protein